MVMRRFLNAFSRYRPRMLTVLLVATIAALLALANLSDEFCGRVSPRLMPGKVEFSFDARQTPRDEVLGMDDLWNLSYGWPLRWRQYVLAFGYGQMAAGPFSNIARLAADVAMWLVMLAVPAAACEWLLRRYRPRFRWSLRTMLIAVGLVAVCCAWFVHARRRTNIEDALAAAIQGQHGRVWFDRWGPTWLELVGVDHLCRRIIGADLGSSRLANPEAEQLLMRLARLPNLQHLFFKAGQLTPMMADALGEMHELRRLNVGVGAAPGLAAALTRAMLEKRGLRALSIDLHDWPNRSDKRTSHELLAEIRKLTQLEALHLASMDIAGESLAPLADLTNLRVIGLDDVNIVDASGPISSLASTLSALRRLEVAAFRDSNIGDRDLRQIDHLPNLKSLIVVETGATSAGLAAFQSLESLEVLTVNGELLSAAALESLRAAKRLRAMHIGDFHGPYNPGVPLKHDQLSSVPASERDACLQALEALRQLHHELVIDHYTSGVEWAEQSITLQACWARERASYARGMVRERQEEQAQKQTATGGK